MIPDLVFPNHLRSYITSLIWQLIANMWNLLVLVHIWVIPPSHSKNLLALVKVQILEPSGRVLPKWLHLCPSGFRKFTCVSAQISRNISMTCLLDGSRSRRSWGFPNFHGFWAAPGAIWSRLDGSTQETDCSIRSFGPCSTNSSKKNFDSSS